MVDLNVIPYKTLLQSFHNEYLQIPLPTLLSSINPDADRLSGFFPASGTNTYVNFTGYSSYYKLLII